MRLILVLVFLTLIACGQEDKTFKEVVTFDKGFRFSSTGVIQTIPYTGGGGTMIYPPAGIPVSTGTVWGTSITNNSINWDIAYNWGNHAGLYRPITWVPTFAQVTSKPTTLSGYGITDAALASHNHSYNTLLDVPETVQLDVAISTLPGVTFPVLTQTQINALTPVKGKVVINSTTNTMQWFDGTIWKTFITAN